MAAAKCKLTGDKELIARLKGLGKKSVTINRQAMNAASTPVLKEERNQCPVHHGDLRKALTKKVYNRGKVAIAIIGADAGYVVSESSGERLQLGATKAESNAIIAAARADGGVIRPAKYDHLVEFGHVTPEGVQVPANPFARKAYEASRATAIDKYASVEKAMTK
jgi:HK97 gp10 family phage protein